MTAFCYDYYNAKFQNTARRDDTVRTFQYKTISWDNGFNSPFNRLKDCTAQLMESQFATISSENVRKTSQASKSAEEIRSRPSLDVDDVKLEIEPINNFDEVPDGGFTAWVQCAGSFLLFFNGFGLINTFGSLGQVSILWSRSLTEFSTRIIPELLRDESALRISI